VIGHETQISRLFFYPIKSFRGLEVKSLHLTSQGPYLDRQWMLVDEKNQFVTQRTMPQLARIGLSIEDGARIELTRDGNFITDFGIAETEEKLNVKIWKDEVDAFEVSTDVYDDLSKLLDKKVKLVRISEESDRPGRFADEEPNLVISEESLKALEERAKTSLSMVRFRPNIVVRNCLPHAEDKWGQFKIGKIQFIGKEACTRCRITQTHPLTGEVGEEPMKTLKTYRSTEKGVAFGFYYGNDQSGEIQVGQSLVF